MVTTSYDAGREIELFKVLRRKHRIVGAGAIYSALKASPDFAAAALGDQDALARLHKEASMLLKAERDRTMRARRSDRRKDAAEHGVPEHERYRAEVVSNEFARLARLFGEHSWDAGGEKQFLPSALSRFRERFLKGRPLSDKEAIALLSSPAAALLSADEFEAGGIPAEAHTARVIRHTRQYLRGNPGIYEEDIVIAVTLKSRKRPKRFKLKRQWEYPLPTLVVPDGNGYRELDVRPLSLFAYLRGTARVLAEHYGWHEGEAVWFVLTDAAPDVPCLKFDRDFVTHNDHLHRRLHLSIFPWVSADTVKRLYLKIQRVAFGHGQNRPTSIRSLKLFDFVSQRRTRTTPVPWRAVMKEWDNSQPKHERYERFGDNGVRIFERDYDRVRAQVVWMRSDRTEEASRAKPKRTKVK